MRSRQVNFCNKVIEDIKSSSLVSKKSYSCYNYVAAFDIETTNDDMTRNSFMYTAQFSFNEDKNIILRSWNDVLQLLKYINDNIQHDLIIYVHNLSYEIQFLEGIYDFKKDDMFCLDNHKVLYAKMYDHIIFRCSYQLTSYSLDKFCVEMDVKNKKVHGFDYEKVRYPWTKLTAFEKSYILNDVIGLVQALKKFIFDIHQTNIANIPLTSTGFVRKDMKEIVNNIISKKKLQVMQPDPYLHGMLRSGFRGGDTHGNRYFTNKILVSEPDYQLISKDESSAYPYTMCCKLFPFGDMKYIGEASIEAIESKIRSGYACLFKITFEFIELKNKYDGCPYLALSKTLYMPDYTFNDNGRILSGKGICLVITDLDWKIIKDTYNFKIYKIEDLYQCKYKMLPEPIRKYIIQLYKNKTALKHSDPVNYMISKQKINACYGMIVQNLLKPMTIYEDGIYKFENKEMDELYKELLRKPFIPYQIGVWVTAWARYCLYEGRKAIGYENFVYSDTDSIKYFETPDNRNCFDKINRQRIKEAKQYGAFAADDKGDIHYMGVYEDDGSYTRFKTLGAKKYAYEDNTGLHLTLAGVNKKSGAKEMGCLENFKIGFEFKESAGLSARYNDNADRYIEREGHRIHITRNLYLAKTTYLLDITKEYQDCIDFAAGNFIDIFSLIE